MSAQLTESNAAKKEDNTVTENHYCKLLLPKVSPQATESWGGLSFSQGRLLNDDMLERVMCCASETVFKSF